MFELVTLRNGHRAVRHTGHGEVMHPSVGPWAEANALYVEQPRLHEKLTAQGAGPLCIYDVGLGAAANAIAVLELCRKTDVRRALWLHSFEIDPQPLRLALSDPQGFPFLSPWRAELEALLEHGTVELDRVRWTLHLGDALALLPRVGDRADVILHDPFSPESNPSLWTAGAFRALRERCSARAELYTYSASTRTRVSLLLGGFFVGVGQAIGTKQETTAAATGREALLQPLGPRWLERWERSTARAPHGAELTEELIRAIRTHPQFA